MNNQNNQNSTYYEDPITDIRLVKCPISLDDKNQLTFNTLNDQLDYFLSLPYKDMGNATYQRRDSVIYYDDVIENLYEYNYVMYKNANYRNKWFFAFISSMKWENNSMTDIFIETDSFQTWQFDLDYKKSFVEREHVNDDTIGKHTIPESLEYGDYITNSDPTKIMTYSTDISDPNGCYICFGITNLPSGVSSSIDLESYRFINGIYGGLIYVVCSDAANAKDFLSNFGEEGRLNYIQTAFMIPRAFTVFTEGGASEVRETFFNIAKKQYIVIKPASDVSKKFINAFKVATDSTININNTIDGYTPKNKKLFTSPYNYIMVTNNAGIDIPMKYEDFKNNTPKFSVYGSITPGCSIKCIPLNYKHRDDNGTLNSYVYGISGAKFPICSWVGDIYTNWLTQNGVNVALSAGGSLLQAGLGIAALGTPATALAGVSMLGSGIIGVGQAVSQVRQASLTPEQTSGDINSGDVNFSTGNSVFTVYPTCIRSEYAKIIDDYFTMFGYKVNSLKVPNITGRRNWNFIKTIDINIEAYIPQEDLQKIKNMFNNGVTLWHNSATFLDYSQNNDII